MGRDGPSPGGPTPGGCAGPRRPRGEQPSPGRHQPGGAGDRRRCGPRLRGRRPLPLGGAVARRPHRHAPGGESSGPGRGTGDAGGRWRRQTRTPFTTRPSAGCGRGRGPSRTAPRPRTSSAGRKTPGVCGDGLEVSGGLVRGGTWTSPSVSWRVCEAIGTGGRGTGSALRPGWSAPPRGRWTRASSLARPGRQPPGSDPSRTVTTHTCDDPRAWVAALEEAIGDVGA